jgi:hypothetical protein
MKWSWLRLLNEIAPQLFNVNYVSEKYLYNTLLKIIFRAVMISKLLAFLLLVFHNFLKTEIISRLWWIYITYAEGKEP